MNIGIMTYHRATNYGAVLQAFALQKKICDNLKEKDSCKIIDYRCKSIESMRILVHFDKRFIKDIIRLPFVLKNDILCIRRFDKFLKDNIILERIKNNDLDSISDTFDLYITGSDQVWNYDVCQKDDAYFLTFVKDDKKKRSYAASFGASRLFIRDKQRILQNLRGFSDISLRENTCINELHSITSNIHIDIDPTLLIDEKEWEQVLNSSIKEKDYILVYCVAPPKELLQIAEKLSIKTGYRVIYLTNQLSKKIKYRKFEFVSGIGPSEFLSYIYNAKIVLTTSYHGTVFSLIFHKLFYAEIDSLNGHNDRIANLIKIIDETSFIRKECVLDDMIKNEFHINWKAIDQKIDSIRRASERYLKNLVDKDRENEIAD